jgi:hypothetical protein
MVSRERRRVRVKQEEMAIAEGSWGYDLSGIWFELYKVCRGSGIGGRQRRRKRMNGHVEVKEVPI